MVKYYYDSPILGLAKFTKPLVEAFNENKGKQLPKYIMMPENDILTSLRNYKIETSLVMGVALHYLVKQVDLLIDRCLTGVREKKPGGIVEDYPKVIWIRMIKCPQNIELPSIKFAQSLRGKYNSLLEECILDGLKDRHCIMSIEVSPEEFSIWGHLSSFGKSTIWKEIDRGLKSLI